MSSEVADVQSGISQAAEVKIEQKRRITGQQHLVRIEVAMNQPPNRPRQIGRQSVAAVQNAVQTVLPFGLFIAHLSQPSAQDAQFVVYMVIAVQRQPALVEFVRRIDDSPADSDAVALFNEHRSGFSWNFPLQPHVPFWDDSQRFRDVYSIGHRSVESGTPQCLL